MLTRDSRTTVSAIHRKLELDIKRAVFSKPTGPYFFEVWRRRALGHQSYENQIQHRKENHMHFLSCDGHLVSAFSAEQLCRERHMVGKSCRWGLEHRG